MTDDEPKIITFKLPSQEALEQDAENTRALHEELLEFIRTAKSVLLVAIDKDSYMQIGYRVDGSKINILGLLSYLILRYKEIAWSEP